MRESQFISIKNLLDRISSSRIHSSSGTTGTPVIIPYTKQDVDDWAEMFKRCYETAGGIQVVQRLSA